MNLMLVLLAVLAVVEISIYMTPLWRARQVLAVMLAISTGVLSGALFVDSITGWSYVALAIAIYRSINMIRIAVGVGSERYLRRSGLRTSLVLVVLYALVYTAWWFTGHANLTGYEGWLAIGALQLAAAIGVLIITRSSINQMKPLVSERGLADHDLPSITVAIPARNETESLQACLEALVACNYPKLEVLVLDDCSQDRTSQIIKGFAHDGVRFVKGEVPPEGWLAKNWAYEQLYQQANGAYIVFCGVDVRFGKNTLRALMATMLANKSQMTSIMPQNRMPANQGLASLLIQPVRYAWEISLPRRLVKRPPVLSTCWVAERRLLQQNGTFAATRNSVSPESHFARRALANGAYQFVYSTPELQVIADKTVADQFETAIRTRYPQLHRRPELVMAVTIVEALLLVAPLPVAVAALCTGHILLAAMSTAALILGNYTYRLVVMLTYRQPLAAGWFLGVPALLLDTFLRHYSMYRYEFSDVIWKGRNVCLPVMQVIPHLPPLPDKPPKQN